MAAIEKHRQMSGSNGPHVVAFVCSVRTSSLTTTAQKVTPDSATGPLVTKVET